MDSGLIWARFFAESAPLNPQNLIAALAGALGAAGFLNSELFLQARNAKRCKAMQSDAKRCKAICLVLVADVWLCVFAHRISHNATCTEESSLVLHGLPLRGKQRACGSTWGWSCSRYKGQGLPKQPQELKNVEDSGRQPKLLGTRRKI